MLENTRHTSSRGALRCIFPLVLGLGACSSDADCHDRDLDGFGQNCASGNDCDDTNALRTNNCDTVPAPDCALTPTATGCSCIAGTSSDCYPAAAETNGVGLCKGGRGSCVNGYWGICAGAVTPEPETCNEQDDNCDGIVDDGVLSPCGGCDDGCTGGVWGQAAAPFTSTAELITTAQGWLTLKRTPLPSAESLWVPNTGDDTVSKIDTNTATEVARYHSGGEEPTRVAVDYNGDAWVLNRAYNGQSTLTKIAGVIDHCQDRNDNDGIETSTGPNDVLPIGQDECVLLSVPVGQSSPAAVGRALAIDGSVGEDSDYGGSVWVGLHDAMQVQERHGQTGALLRTIDTPGFAPYAAAFDGWGRLWMISGDGLLARIDRSASPLEATIFEVPLACYLLYGFAVDSNDELLLSGFHCDQAVHYSPDSDVWRTLSTVPSARGVAVNSDVAWIAHTDGSLSKVDVPSFSVIDVYSLTDGAAQPFESIGVTTHHPDSAWVISSQNLLGSGGVVTHINSSDGSIKNQIPVGNAPHVQGDSTGAARRGTFMPQGIASHVFEGCDDGRITSWKALYIQADSGTSGSIAIAIRRATSVDGLDDIAFDEVGVFPSDTFPVMLEVPGSGVLEVRVTLQTSTRDGAPRLKQVGVQWQCTTGGIF